MKQALTLFIVLLLSSCLNNEEGSEEAKVLETYRQEYYVGDKLDTKGEDIDFQSTKDFTTPTIEIREANYTIKVSKDDIIKQLELLASEIDSIEYEDVIKALNISRNYLASSGDVAFDQMWSAAEKEGIGWSEVEKHDEHLVAKNVLREQICELLESGKFQLIEGGKEQKLYYFKRVNSNYGGNVKGVFSKSNQMIWMCPPFEIE